MPAALLTLDLYPCLSNISIYSQSFATWYVRDDEGALVLAPAENHDEKKANRVFSEALRGIKNASFTFLGQQIPIGVVVHPEHFNRSTITSLRKAAMDVEPSLLNVLQFKRFFSGARLAYGLDSCLRLNPEAADCDMEGSLNLVNFVEYDPQLLELTLADVGEFGAYPEPGVSIDIAEHSSEFAS